MTGLLKGIFTALKKIISFPLNFLGINKKEKSSFSRRDPVQGTYSDKKFKGYSCENCGTFYEKREFGPMVEKVKNAEIDKAYRRYSDEYQKLKPKLDNPEDETTDYCPSCSYNRDDIRRFKLVYQEIKQDCEEGNN